MTIETTIQAWANETNSLIIKNYKDMGLRASGQFERDLENTIEVVENGYKILFKGSKHTEYMELGRRRNKDQNKVRGFAYWASKSFIRQWCIDKGIDTKAAYPIALKIAMDGIKVPNPFNRGGVVSNVLNKQRVDVLMKNLSGVMTANLTSEIFPK